MTELQLQLRDAPTITLGAGARQERLAQAIDEFYAAIDAGQPVDRERLLEKYSDVADELDDCLRNLDFIQNIAPQLSTDNGAQTADAASTIAQRTQLGDYKIIREIGRGGMGVVYEAEQLSLGRRVALKVLPFAAMLDKQQLARFKNEARAAATLKHPNIVSVYSIGCERSVHFFAMELVEGQSLAQVVQQLRRENGRTVEQQNSSGVEQQRSSGVEQQSSDYSTTPPLHYSTSADTERTAALSTLPDFNSREYFRSIAQLGIQAAEALDHAHQNGILHRDIKPANLLLDDTGKLWITDFGLARLETDAGMTMTGDILGTLRYMSPEQALAKRVVVDHRSDIYSLGVTLYELLTLQQAFTGDDRQELLRQIAFEEPPPLHRINPSIPADLETIVLKAIEKNPADRYATAQALANDLRCCIEHKPITAKPAVLQRTRKWTTRHPKVLFFTAIILIVVSILSTAGSILLAQANSRETNARKQAELEQAKADRERRRAEQTLGRMQLQAGVTLLNQGNALGLLELFDAFETSADLPIQQESCRRLWAIGFSARRHTLDQVLNSCSGGLAYSPDGELLATADSQFVRLWNARTGELQVPPIQTDMDARSAFFSPDGQRLAIHFCGGETRLWDPNTGAAVGPVLKQESAMPEQIEVPPPWGAQFSPDGKVLAAVGPDGAVRMRDSRTGELKGQLHQSTSAKLVTVAFSPDGMYLAAGSENGTVSVWNVATGTLHGQAFRVATEQINPINKVITKIAFNPNSESLALICHDGFGYVFDAQTTKLEARIESDQWFSDFAFSPDGNLIVTGSTDWTVRLWDASSGEQRGEPMRHEGRVRAVAFSPKGDLVASCSVDGTLRLWETAKGKPYGPPIQQVDVLNRVAFLATGEFLATGYGDTRVWRIQSIETPRKPSHESEKRVREIRSPDNKYLARIDEQQGVELVEVAQGSDVHKLLTDGRVMSVAFSPDSKLLATGFDNWRATLWDVATGREVASIFCGERVYGVAFSPNGRLLATALFNGKVVLWDVGTNAQHGLPIKHPSPVWDLAFSPDGNLLATVFGTPEGRFKAKLWDIAGDAPYLGLTLPFELPTVIGALDSFSLTGKLLTGGNHANAAWRLPELPKDVKEVRLRTWTALGVRYDLRRYPTLISADEWRSLKKTLNAVSANQ